MDQTILQVKCFLGCLLTFLKAEAGAISAPLSVRRRNMGHEDAFILKPECAVDTKQSPLLNPVGNFSSVFKGLSNGETRE